MRSRLIISIGVFAVVVLACAEGWRRIRLSRPADLRLRMALTYTDNIGEVDDLIRSSFAQKYAGFKLSDGYSIYSATTGSSRWLIFKVFNAPRGLGMFNLYCYESRGSESWILRSYVPVNWMLYTNTDALELQLSMAGEYFNVLFRNVAVFTSKCDSTNLSYQLIDGEALKHR